MRVVAFSLVLLAPSGVLAEEPFDRPALEAFLDTLEADYAALTSLSYRFEQVQRMPELTKEIELVGTVLHQRPAEVRLEVRGMENFDLLSDGTTVWFIDRDFGDVESFSIAELRTAPQSRLLPPLLLDNPARWRLDFEVVEFEENGSRRRLVLEPGASANRRFESVTLVFKGRRLKESTVHYGEGDEAITRYSDWKRVGKVSHAIFRYRSEK
ncbi:MAG: outer membrane lipoprotein carrier protein LolA [Thermoanaerobaculales bacterium]